MEAHKRDHSVIRLRFDNADYQWMRNKIFIQWMIHPRRRTRGIIMWASCCKGLGYDGRGWAVARLQSALPLLLLIILRLLRLRQMRPRRCSAFCHQQIEVRFMWFWQKAIWLFLLSSRGKLEMRWDVFEVWVGEVRAWGQTPRECSVDSSPWKKTRGALEIASAECRIDTSLA